MTYIISMAKRNQNSTQAQSGTERPLCQAMTPPKPSGPAFISLTQDQVAIVDAKDFGWLNQWKWCAVNTPKGFVAARNERMTGGIQGTFTFQKTIYMHRQIMNAPEGKMVYHRNYITLDNQRHNLRICTYNQNQQEAREYIEQLQTENRRLKKELTNRRK